MKQSTKIKKPNAHQDLETRALEQGDLIGDGEVLESGNALGELDDLDDGLCAERGELLPQFGVGGSGRHLGRFGVLLLRASQGA